MTRPRPLPVVLDAPAAPDALSDVLLAVRRLPGGRRYVRLAADLAVEDADVVRRLAERLLDAARSLGGDT